MNGVKALTFDTGGTILDWHGGISRSLAGIGARRGINADWKALTNVYRLESLQGMTGGAADFRPDFNIDDVHRRQIEDVAKAQGVSGLTASDFDEVRDAWHELDCWPDVPNGLARMRRNFICASLTILSVRLIVDTCKRAGIVWDAVISCEMIGAYKPRPEAYLRAAQWLQLQPGECMMVAAHKLDLAAAARAGFRTAYVHRPDEWGGAPEPAFAKGEVTPDYTAESFEDLATQLGCAG